MTLQKQQVLFVCVRNSARSQMAEERLAQTRKVREAIRASVAAWVRSLAPPREA